MSIVKNARSMKMAQKLDNLEVTRQGKGLLKRLHTTPKKLEHFGKQNPICHPGPLGKHQKKDTKNPESSSCTMPRKYTNCEFPSVPYALLGLVSFTCLVKEKR
jgi:hypothetical protein